MKAQNPPPQVERPSPFQFADYKAFLAAMQMHGRGETRRMSEAAGCQRSYFSQVIHGNVQLTPDHGFKLCKYFQFNSREQDFFLTQLELARAATAEYRAYLEEKLVQIKRAQENPKAKATPEQLQYFSSWHWSAIHLLTSIPGYEQASAIAERLRLPQNLVLQTLESLAKRGLVKHEGNLWKYASGEQQV